VASFGFAAILAKIVVMSFTAGSDSTAQCDTSKARAPAGDITDSQGLWLRQGGVIRKSLRQNATKLSALIGNLLKAFSNSGLLVGIPLVGRLGERRDQVLVESLVLRRQILVLAH
jgi:hypothetical protein